MKKVLGPKYAPLYFSPNCLPLPPKPFYFGRSLWAGLSGAGWARFGARLCEHAKLRSLAYLMRINNYGISIYHVQ